MNKAQNYESPKTSAVIIVTEQNILTSSVSGLDLVDFDGNSVYDEEF